MTRSSWVRAAVLWLGLFLVVAGSNWSQRFQPYWWDALGYVLPHAREIHDANLFPILRQWDVGHPTAYYFLLAVSMKIWGVGPMAGHLLNWSFTALALVAVLGICRSLRLPRLLAAGCVAVVWAFPLMRASSQQVMGDLALAALCLAALWAWAGRRWSCYLLCASLAVLTKFHGILLVLAVCLAVVADAVGGSGRDGKRRWRPLSRELAWSAAPILPLLLFLAVRYLVRGPGWTLGWPPKQHFLPVWHWEGFAANWERATTNLWDVSKLGTPLWITGVLLLVVGLVVWRQRRRHGTTASARFDSAVQRRQFLVLVSFLIVGNGVFLQISALMARYSLPLAGAVFPLLFLLVWWLSRRRSVVLLVQGALLLVYAFLWYPDHVRILPRPVADWIHPGRVRTGHHFEADLRYHDVIALIRWADTTIRADAALRGQEQPRQKQAPGVATRWPVISALTDPAAGYVTSPLRTQAVRSWQDIDATGYPYVLVVEGISQLPPSPSRGLFRAQRIASRQQGEARAHVWHVADASSR